MSESSDQNLNVRSLFMGLIVVTSALFFVFSANLATTDESTLETDKIETPSPKRTQAIAQLSSLLPQEEQDILNLAQMSEAQIITLTTLLVDYYFAGISDAVQESKVNEEFEGWDGDTMIELTDDCTFKQKEFHIEYTYRYRPDVTIFLDLISYKNHVEDTDEPIEVELIDQPRFGSRLFGRCKRMKTLLLKLHEDT